MKLKGYVESCATAVSACSLDGKHSVPLFVGYVMRVVKKTA